MTRQHRRTIPRSEFHLPVAQMSEGLSYVPERTPDEDMAALYEDGPAGIRITKDQKFGNAAMLYTYDWAVREGTEEDQRTAARLVSYVGFGTSYYLYAERYVEDVMYRKPPLAEGIDRATGWPTTLEKLNTQVLTGLAAAAGLAMQIEHELLEQRPDEDQNILLGAIMAHTALIAAAVAEKVDKASGGPIAIQNSAYMAGTKTYLEMHQLSGNIEALITSAQFANPYSPLMVNLNTKNKRLKTKKNQDEPDLPLITNPVLNRLKLNIAGVIASESRP